MYLDNVHFNKRPYNAYTSYNNHMLIALVAHINNKYSPKVTTQCDVYAKLLTIKLSNANNKE